MSEIKPCGYVRNGYVRWDGLEECAVRPDLYTPLYDASALAAKDAEIADMLTTICEQQDEIKALQEREETHDAEIARLRAIEAALSANIVDDGQTIERLRGLVAGLSDALDRALSDISKMPPYEAEWSRVAEARKESP